MSFLRNPGDANDVDYILSGTLLSAKQKQKVKELKLTKGTYLGFHQDQLITHHKSEEPALKEFMDYCKTLDKKPEGLHFGQLGMMPREVFMTGFVATPTVKK